MADVDDTQFSLLSLEEELTCSICLSPFDCPVTTPCGHNFCRECLLASWEGISYSCPQCRTCFPTPPDLKKNTVLSAVVATFRDRSERREAGVPREEEAVVVEDEEVVVEEEEKAKVVIRCDSCMEADATQTCFTCMASFCDEHLRPHRENPIYRVHQLSPPVADLLQRICPEHHKLMELFCSQHDRLICSLCLHQSHKNCTFTSPEDRRGLQQVKFKQMMDSLNEKVKKNENVIYQLTEMQYTLKDAASDRKKALAGEYQQMRDMLAQEERDALNTVDQELQTSQGKLDSFLKRFTANIITINRSKEEVSNLLSQAQTLAFLQASVTLPQAANFEPYAPRITLDSKKLMATHAFAADLKEHLSTIIRTPLAIRTPLMKAGERPAPLLGFMPSTFGQLPNNQDDGQAKAANKKKVAKKTNPADHLGQKKNLARSTENLLNLGGKDKNKSRPPKPAGTPDVTPLTTFEKRSDLLKYGVDLTFDMKTAHRRIILSEDFTQASVSDHHVNYPNNPERFAVCSQVLTSKGFSSGRHYWEVRMSSNNFVGIGLAYDSINRKGPTSRLGRNTESWCVEWYNVKLSAWHNSNETVLSNPSPRRVGVLLDIEAGSATFYNVADRAYPFHTFVFPFAKAVFPAFWIFTSGSSVSLCKLQS